MKVTLKKAHRHAEQDYPEGAEIEVSKPDAEWLRARGVIDEPGLRKAADKAADTSSPDNVRPIKS